MGDKHYLNYQTQSPDTINFFPSAEINKLSLRVAVVPRVDVPELVSELGRAVPQ